MYIKQWRKRYRQLEGLNDPFLWKQSHLIEHCDDWYLTARTILDIDIAYMNSREYNKFNLENYNQNFDLIFNRTSADDEEFETDNDKYPPFDTIALNSNLSINHEIITALNTKPTVLKKGKNESKRNRILKNSKISSEENKVKEHKLVEKQVKISQNLPKVAETKKPIPTETLTIASTSPNTKVTNRAPRVKNIKPKIRVASTRRQMYICEFPGCTYQSDRNFNFLRHKRTHGKQKNDDKRTTSSTPIINTSCFLKTSATENIFNKPPNCIMTTDPTFERIAGINENNQTPLLSHLDVAVPFNNSLPINLSDDDHSYMLSENFLQQNLMKDINNYEPIGEAFLI